MTSTLARLEALGHRATGPRRTVAQAVLSQRGHFTAEELGQQLPDVGRATVFRTLKLLAEMGVVCRVLLEDGRFRYRISYPDHHHHLVCLACGRVEDLVDGSLEATVRRVVQKTRYTSEGHWLEVYGRCPDCQRGQSHRRGEKAARTPE